MTSIASLGNHLHSFAIAGFCKCYSAQAAAARDSFLKAAGHTTHGSQALRMCDEDAFSKSVRDGEALSSVLDAQRWVTLQIALFVGTHQR